MFTCAESCWFYILEGEDAILSCEFWMQHLKSVGAYLYSSLKLRDTVLVVDLGEQSAKDSIVGGYCGIISIFKRNYSKHWHRCNVVACYSWICLLHKSKSKNWGHQTIFIIIVVIIDAF